MRDRESRDPGAAFNERVAAYLLDWLVLGGAAFLAGGGGAAGLGAALVVTLLNVGIAPGLTGYSLGKAIAGVRVARVDTTEPPGVVAGLIRWAAFAVDNLFAGLVGLIVSGRTQRRQRVGDLVARTWVIGLRPAARARAIAGVAFLALCLALLFVRSTAAGLAVAAVLIPVALGVTVIVAGVGGRRAPWPWLAGLGVALVPACWMASVKTCDQIAGTCISGDDLSNSRQAVVSVILLLIAAGLLVLRRSPARDAAFAALVLLGQLWLLVKLIDSRERPETIMVIALIALEIGYEIVSRVRRARDRAAEAAPAAPA